MARRRRIRPPRRTDVSPWPFVGLVLVVGAFFLYAAVPVVLDPPWWGVVAFLLVWLGFFVTGCRWFTTRTVGLVVLGVASYVVWFGLVQFAARVLGWA